MNIPAFSRRRFLETGCAVCASLAAERHLLAAELIFDGCLLSSIGYAQYKRDGGTTYPLADGIFARNRHWRTTGNTSLDRDLDRALTMIADVLSVNPAFGFYDPAKLADPLEVERNGMGAWASPESTDIPGTWGTVGFGWQMFQEEFYHHDPSGVSIVAIVAHEFGHILQGQRGYLLAIRNGTPLRSEINADYLPGYYLGTRKLKNKSLRFERAGNLMMRLGSNGPNRTHGSAQERLDAAEAGFRAAYVERRSLDQAVDAGLEYIRYSK